MIINQWLYLQFNCDKIAVPQVKQPSTAMSTTLRVKLMGSSKDFDRSVGAYHNMNKFLAAFLEHVSIKSVSLFEFVTKEDVFNTS